MTESFNDNEVAPDPANGPDAHGQAAMLLVESLIHGLVARSVIGMGDAIEIVEVAADVKAELASDMGDSHGTLRKSLNILNAISKSLEIDRARDEAND